MIKSPLKIQDSTNSNYRQPPSTQIIAIHSDLFKTVSKPTHFLPYLGESKGLQGRTGLPILSPLHPRKVSQNASSCEKSTIGLDEIVQLDPYQKRRLHKGRIGNIPSDSRHVSKKTQKPLYFRAS